MGAEANAKALGIEFTDDAEKAYLNMVARVGKTLLTSGHVSEIKGKLGADLDVEQGYAAARECGVSILQSVHQEVGTLDGLRVVKLLGMVNCTPEFGAQPAVINGCSELFRDVWGTDHGVGTRSAYGVSDLPAGVAVEIEGILKVRT